MKTFKPLSGREYPRFSGIKTFFRLPIAEASEDFDVAIQGVPFDGSVSFRPGARFGPSAVREASSLGRVFHLEQKRSWVENIKVADVGDVSVNPLSIVETLNRIEAQTLQLLQARKRVLSVGGDHLTTLGHLRAYRKHFQRPLALVHFDAHLDSYPAAWGEEYHHGTFVRHAVKEGLIDPKRTLQIGIRGPLAGVDDLSFAKTHGISVLTVDHIKRTQAHLVQLPNLEGPTYMTFDVDVLDPAYAPGTGTPVVGGLSTYEAQTLLRSFEKIHFVGGDVVEVAPPFDHAQITSLAAVDVLFEMLIHLARHCGTQT